MHDFFAACFSPVALAKGSAQLLRMFHPRIPGPHAFAPHVSRLLRTRLLRMCPRIRARRKDPCGHIVLFFQQPHGFECSSGVAVSDGDSASWLHFGVRLFGGFPGPPGGPPRPPKIDNFRSVKKPYGCVLKHTTPGAHYEMALELVSGADFWCKLMSGGRPVDLRGSRGRF